MPKEYILTTMFFADDYSLRLTAVANHVPIHRAEQSVQSIPYDDHHSRLPSATIQKGSLMKATSQEENEQASAGDSLCSLRQATIDLGQVHCIDWLWWWPEPDKTSRVPRQWQIDVSLDGETYVSAYSVSRFGYLFGTAYLVNASCHPQHGEISLAPVKARFIRFHFDNVTRDNFLDEWAIELRLTSLNQDRLPVFNIQPIALPQFV